MTVKTRGHSRTTIYDVADHAGVSASTVSRVLNRAQCVSDTTRASVLNSIQELRFSPDRTAKSLAQRATQTIAVAVPACTNLFHSELLKGIRDCLNGTGIDLLLCDLDWKAPRITLVNFLSRGAMDGLLLAGMPVDEEIAEDLEMLGIPIVLIGSEWPTLDFFSWQEEAGARMATEHLIGRGHERIGMITTPNLNRLYDARITGYREALTAAGIGFDESLIAYGLAGQRDAGTHDSISKETGYKAMVDLLHLSSPVTAVFASSDVQAIGAWKAIRNSAHSVPGDYALVGYGDLQVSRFIGLTSVAQNIRDVGESATRVLLQRLCGEGDDQPVSQLVRTELRVRRSS